MDRIFKIENHIEILNKNLDILENKFIEQEHQMKILKNMQSINDIECLILRQEIKELKVKLFFFKTNLTIRQIADIIQERLLDKLLENNEFCELFILTLKDYQEWLKNDYDLEIKKRSYNVLQEYIKILGIKNFETFVNFIMNADDKITNYDLLLNLIDNYEKLK